MSSSPYFIKRIRLIGFLIFAMAGIFILKLYMLQVVSGDSFRDRAEHQYVKPNQNIYDRGSIFLSNKDGSLFGGAILKSGFTAVINPKKINDPEAVYEKLSSVLSMPKPAFLERAGKTGREYEEIEKRLEPEKAEKIEEMDLPGVSLNKEKWRYYPGERLASHVLGFVGYQGEELRGQYGLERYYEDVLNRNGALPYSNFFAEIFSGAGKIAEGDIEGDLITSLEPSVEKYLEDALSLIYSKNKAEGAGGIIMNPANGEIYAAAAMPSFDPNSFKTEKSSGVFLNPLVESVYEMGSILKPLTVAAGIDSGTITAESTYFDEGFLVLDGSKISNFDGKGRGLVSMQEVLNQSLNTGAAYVAGKMGNEKFKEYMFRFGLGEKTGIDLPGEVAGLTKNLKNCKAIECATTSYGHGIALTPIMTARALSALANGGTLVSPRVVKKINYKVGLSKNISYPEGERAVKKETSEEVTRMLVEVVDKALLEGKMKMEHYSIAAKTGTAQIPKKGGGGYYEDRYIHSFFGYFPAYNPKFLVFLYLVDPKDADFASHTLTSPFIDITKFLINYYQVPPDR